MELKEHLRKELIKELREIAKKMKEEQDIRKKVYFYSAAHGVVERCLRFDFDQELLLISLVLNGSHGLLRERADLVAMGDRLIPLSNEVLDKLGGCIKELTDNIERKSSTQNILEKIALLTYVATGPGHYMDKMGQLKEALSSI